MIEFLIALPMIVLSAVSLIGVFQPKWRGICWPLLIGSGVGLLALLYSVFNPFNPINTYIAIDSFMSLWLVVYALRFMSEEASAQALILGVAVLAHALLAWDVEYGTNMVYVYYEYAIATLTFLQCYLLRGVFDGIFERLNRNRYGSRPFDFKSRGSSSVNSSIVVRDKKE